MFNYYSADHNASAICQSSKQITENRNVALRNTKAVYLLQHVAYCECGSKIGCRLIRYGYKKLDDGKKQRYDLKNPRRTYYCFAADE